VVEVKAFLEFLPLVAVVVEQQKPEAIASTLAVVVQGVMVVTDYLHQ
jgi:hypothetical protein